MSERLLGIALDEGFDECGFADPWGAHDGDDDRRRLSREPIDKGDMEAFLFYLAWHLSRSILKEKGVKAHRESAPLVSGVSLDSQRRMLWDSCLVDSLTNNQ